MRILMILGCLIACFYFSVAQADVNLAAPVSAAGAGCEKPALSPGELFAEQFLGLNCVAPGAYCNSSNDCCGSSFCTNGVCNSNSGCVAPGLACSTSGDCCGSSFCRDGFCSMGTTCSGPGGHCSSSNDCCGSSFCRDGGCTTTGGGSCVPTGGICGSSIDCCGSSFCRDHSSGYKVCS